MFEQNLTISDLVRAEFYGEDRATGRARIRRQNRSAKRAYFTASQAVLLTVAEHADLVTRLRAFVDAAGDNGARVVTGESALLMMQRAEPSYRRAGHVAVMLSHPDAVLLGNVLRRLEGPVPGLARIDVIACRDPRRAS